MMKKLIIAATLMLMLGSASVLAQFTPIDAIVAVDTAYVEPGDQFVLEIRMENNSYEIAALGVPLQYVGDGLTLDSVSFAGTLKSDDFLTIVDYGTDSSYVRIIYIANFYDLGYGEPTPTLTASSGVLAKLHFQVSASAPAQVIPIDSVNRFDTKGIHVVLTDTTGTINYLPQFVPGAVVVQSPTAVDDENDLLPSEFMLAQNYPNPFNPTTAIQFALPNASHVTLDVFNVLGRKVVRLVDDHYSAGIHRIDFDASDQPSGIYFYRLTYEGGAETKKMVFLK